MGREDAFAGEPTVPAPHPGLPAAAFAPQAHLPKERRLLIDGSAVVLETALGVRNTLTWSRCQAILVWPDRAEVVLDDEVSVVVRARDWHHGDDAVRAIRQRAPSQLLVPMPDDPEPEPSAYVLRGLSTCSVPVLSSLLALGGVVAVSGLSVGISDGRLPAVLVALPFAALTWGTITALVARFRVPRAWRPAAAVRGRASVRLDSSIAGASDSGLRIAQASLYSAAALVLVVLLATHHPSLWPPLVLLGMGFAVQRERDRRSRR